MKTLFLVPALLFAISASAQPPGAQGSGPSSVVKCTGGTGANFTTLTFTTMGLAGSMAQIEQGSFKSAQIPMMRSGGMSAAMFTFFEDRATNGKVLDLGIDFINPGSKAMVTFKDPAKKITKLPDLHCNRI